MPESNGIREKDGSTTFEGGVDSGRLPTVRSESNPTGLRRNQLAWAINCTMRGGGILQRPAWLKIVDQFSHDGDLFQGGALYVPDGDVPYALASIGGRIIRFNVWTNGAVIDLSQQFSLFNPGAVEKAFFCQGENVMVIQAGDFVTLPLFWDGATLRRSNGILPPSNGNAGGNYTIQPTAIWTVPNVGVQVVIPLTAPYPGILNDVGTYGVVGTFAVDVIAGNNLTLRTIASDFIGANIAATAATFAVPSTLGAPNAAVNEIPSGQAMDYFMGRLWVQVSSREYTAGDIAYRGAVPYNRQSFLQFTENAYLAGGGRFNVPSNAGPIRAIFHNSEMDTALGQGQLMIGTHEAIYALTVPPDRTTWAAVNNSTQMPLQRVVQVKYGPTSDRSIVRINNDVFYQAYDGIRSQQMAVRYFHQWGQVPISRNVNRVLRFNDRSLSRFGSGIEFDNRLLQTALPFTTPVGVAHKAATVLDFDLLTSMGEREPPAWEGIYEDLDVLQLLEASSGGLQRAFAFAHSRETGNIQIWEIPNFSRFGTGDKRVQWYVEFPAFNAGKPLELKLLDSAEIWLDKVYGAVSVLVDYRPDFSPCWKNWHLFNVCAKRTNCEDNPSDPDCFYPSESNQECDKMPLVLPHPPSECLPCNKRPSNIGYQFQVRLTITGWCRVRAIILHMLPRKQEPYAGLVC